MRKNGNLFDRVSSDEEYDDEDDDGDDDYASSTEAKVQETSIKEE